MLYEVITGKQPQGFEADRIIDGTGYLAMPSLINSHTHLSMGLMRNYKDDLPTPVRPSIRASHTGSMPMPTGVTSPRPVMTIRRLLGMLLDIFNGVANGTDAFRVGIRDIRNNFV